MNHITFLARIAALCDESGLLWHYCPDSRRCRGPRGFPDLIIASPSGVIHAELKTDHDSTTAQQDLWLWTLDRAGQRQVVWYPAHLTDGTIRRALEEIR